ncbi:DNA-directed RNA polymerase subunit alpha [Candidatus Margulisiibacteriota bacterium]
MIGEKPWVRYLPETDVYGRFVVEPLEKGYGSTLGNALRRVLLSSLPGAAVTSIKIDGVSHEFSTIPGVLEDVLGIILNIKELVIKMHGDGPKVITLKTKGKGEVTAEKIEHDAEVEIINKEQKIATLEGNGKLNIEMIVEKGKGYVPADRNKKPNLAIGTIPVDSLFAPVHKVNLSTEEVRVGQEINYDRLVLDVWTNGGTKPDDAVRESAKILAKHVDMFVNIGQRAEALGIAVSGKEETKESVLEMSVEDLELSARSSNCLKKAGIKIIRDVMEYSELDLMRIKNFGAKSAREVKEKLEEYKINLKPSEEIPEEPEKKKKPAKAGKK